MSDQVKAIPISLGIHGLLLLLIVAAGGAMDIKRSQPIVVFDIEKFNIEKSVLSTVENMPPAESKKISRAEGIITKTETIPLKSMPSHPPKKEEPAPALQTEQTEDKRPLSINSGASHSFTHTETDVFYEVGRGVKDIGTGQGDSPSFLKGLSPSSNASSGAVSHLSQAGVDTSGFINALRERIESKKKYPFMARRKGIEGTVVLHIRLSHAGELINVSVSASSGFEILDRAAIELIKRAFPFRHNIGKDMTVELPIKYSLVNQ